MADAYDFLVRKDALHETRVAPAADPTLAPGQILAAVDRFALTANNVTYAVFGDMMQYWQFYPGPDGWGRIPVWGFADVVRSEHPDVRVGERLFGYWPMSTHAVLQPDEPTPLGFRDATPHRQTLAAVYNAYTRTAGDPAYDRAHEDAQMLLRVLFFTGFLIDDLLADQAFFGARSVVLASASSKTAIATAHCLHTHRRGQVEVVGLTSPRNRTFVESLGCYDRVVPYDEIAALPSDTPTAFVDMAGDGAVVRRVHEHFGEALRYSGIVGASHWDKVAMGQSLPGVAPAFFFAPDQIAKRTREWGAAGLQERMGTAWRAFLAPAARWFRVVHGRGPGDLDRVYQDVLAGRSLPDEGHVLSPAA